jgi:hypothetical protein
MATLTWNVLSKLSSVKESKKLREQKILGAGVAQSV